MSLMLVFSWNTGKYRTEETTFASTLYLVIRDTYFSLVKGNFEPIKYAGCKFDVLTQKSNFKIVNTSETNITQPAITCSKLTIGTLEQGVKYVQS